jgi:peptidoglycan lytic transglycosylase
MCVLAATPLRAEAGSLAVLSGSDVTTYRAAFEAEFKGAATTANALIAKLSDRSLVGYLKETYLMSPHSGRASFAALKDWLRNYGELAGADDVFRLASKRAPRRAGVPAPHPVHWRGIITERAAFGDMTLSSALARRTDAQLRKLENAGKPETADELLKHVAHRLSPSDADTLTAYVAAGYLADAKDARALSLAEEAIARGAKSSPQCHWVAGLAAYRMERFEDAANHFEAVTKSDDSAARTNSGASFWAARSWMRAGRPERVLPLYRHAAEMPDTFYGLLALRMMGEDPSVAFKEPKLDDDARAVLLKDDAVHRAIALWQVGRASATRQELVRAFAEIPPDDDAAFAGLARTLGAPGVELHAAENATERGIRLTSLYPIPPYQPAGGYRVDEAVVLAFARQESKFEADALSPAGARGLMQIMPATAAIVAHDKSLAGRDRAKLDDPEYSLTLGQTYLENLLDLEDGSLLALAAAYNAGAGNVAKWTAARDGLNDPLLFIESLPVPETRDYIKRVMMNIWMYRLRLHEPIDSVDDAAAGRWPMYKSQAHG